MEEVVLSKGLCKKLVDWDIYKNGEYKENGLSYWASDGNCNVSVGDCHGEILYTFEWGDVLDAIKAESLEVPVEIKIKMTEQDVEDLVVTAIEGGIGYWACLDNTSTEFDDDEPTSVIATRVLLRGDVLTFYDEEDDDKELQLNLARLLKGVRLYVEGGYDRYGVFSSDGVNMYNCDAEVADSVFQLALFGDIIYG